MLYTCSVCQAKIDGDILALKDHSEQHIVDLIKHDHPDWIANDGVCHKCYDYYKKEINGSTFKDASCALRKRKVSNIVSGIKKVFGKNG